jgi:hypothetical protein
VSTLKSGKFLFGVVVGAGLLYAYSHYSARKAAKTS